MRVLTPIVENIPADLTDRDQWVPWRLESRPGDATLTKVPYDSIPGRHNAQCEKEAKETGQPCRRIVHKARAGDPATWASRPDGGGTARAGEEAR